MQLLSIIIPAYNEAAYIGTLLERIVNVDTESLGYEKEIVVVNDGSTDQTGQIVNRVKGIKCVNLYPNQGKGRAVRHGISGAHGDWILIQDADMEYNPMDYCTLLSAIGSTSSSVYGSRTLGQIRERGWMQLFPGKHPNQGIGPWLAGVVLSCWTFCLFGCWLSDTLTAYKLYPAQIIKKMKLETTGFETDHEITAKLIRGGVKIKEVPIRYSPRSIEEGKKIKPIDGLKALWTLLKFRFKS